MASPYSLDERAAVLELIKRKAPLGEAVETLGRAPVGVADFAKRNYAFTAWEAEHRRSVYKKRGPATGIAGQSYSAGEIEHARDMLKRNVSVYDAAERMSRPVVGLADMARRKFGTNVWVNEVAQSVWRSRERHSQLQDPNERPFRVSTRHASKTAEIVEHTFCDSLTEAEAVMRQAPGVYMGGDFVNAHLFRKKFGHYGKWVPVTESVAA